jgi:hypothetical protein
MHEYLFGAILAASAQLARTDCGWDELYGPVRTVATTFQSLQKEADGSIDTDRRPVGSDSYDPACNLVEHKYYSVDFVADERPERLDATTVVVHSNVGDDRLRIRFDASGNRIESWKTVAANGSFLDHSAYRYDAGGRVIRIDSFDGDGKPYGYTAFTRDADENVVREDFSFGDGRHQVETFSYEFDARGNWTKRFESGDDPDAHITTIQPIGILFRTITYYG